MFGFLKKIKELETSNQELTKRLGNLEGKVEELSKKTISQKTLEEELPTLNQILDEYLNGEEIDDEN